MKEGGGPCLELKDDTVSAGLEKLAAVGALPVGERSYHIVSYVSYRDIIKLTLLRSYLISGCFGGTLFAKLER